MHYRWTEKEAELNKEYHFIMWYEEECKEVVIRCTYDGYATQEVFSKDEERFIYQSLDEMKERLYGFSNN